MSGGQGQGSAIRAGARPSRCVWPLCVAPFRAVLVCAWAEAGAAALGPDGILVRSEAFPPESLVDTLGAGDTFNAAVIYTLANGRSRSLSCSLTHPQLCGPLNNERGKRKGTNFLYSCCKSKKPCIERHGAQGLDLLPLSVTTFCMFIRETFYFITNFSYLARQILPHCSAPIWALSYDMLGKNASVCWSPDFCCDIDADGWCPQVEVCRRP